MTPFPKIDLGETPDDGRGDTLRDAFAKVNAGFEYLSVAIGAHLSARGVFAPRRHEHVTYVTREIRQTPPDEAPALLGAVWIDVARGDIYLAVGTEQVSDWRKVAFAEPVA
jgi:hypothetical protein